MLEAYQKELDKKEVSPEEQKRKPENKTLKEILSKQEDSDLFGEMLGREGDLDLSKRMATGTLTTEDISYLDAHRKDFLSTMEDVKNVKESITNDVVNAYTKNNPELQKVVGLVGLDAYRDIVKEKMARMAIRDPEAFKSLSDAVKSKNEFKSGIYKELDEEVTKMCADRNIQPTSYLKAMAIEDPKQRDEALKLAVRENWNNWKKAADLFTFGTWGDRRAKLMGSKKEELDLASEVMREHKGKIGEFLAGMTDVPEVRNAVAKELIGEKEEKVPVQGFKESKGQMPTEQSFQDGWKAYKTKNKILKSFETMDPDQQDVHRDAFLEMEKKKMEEMNGKKSGFWNAIFSIFSSAFIDDNRNKLN